MKQDWPIIFEHGKILSISERTSKNGNFCIIQLRNDNDELRYYQLWDHAYEQIRNQEFGVNDIVEFKAWPSYYKKDNKNKISFKADNLYGVGTKIFTRLRLRSPWLKDISAGKERWRFTAEFLHEQGLVTHCIAPLNLKLFSLLNKPGNIIDVVAYQRIEDYNGSDRMVLDIISLEEVK